MAEGRIEHGGNTVPGGFIRASDAERDQVIAALQQHYVDGRITDEELSERVNYLIQTRTRGALAKVTHDLPPLDEPAAPAAPAAPRADRRHGRMRQHLRDEHSFMPMMPALFGLMGLLFILPNLAFVVFDGRFVSVPIVPLLIVLIVMLVARRASRRRWR